MAEPTPPAAADAAAAATSSSSANPSTTAAAASSASSTKPKPQNPALRMMGLPALPRKLPSRNWLIFWTLSTALTAAIIHDRREKRRATARWARAVSHLAKEPVPGGNPSAMPRKLTIYLEAPPGDSLRVAQEHFREYVKPVLAASGLDWEFRQGRQQGDIRAVVAEEVRKRRRRVEKDLGGSAADSEEDIPTDEEALDAWRREHGVAEYDGVRGDIVVGRHTWKEYVRGLHEGWLGPLKMPPHAQPDPEPEPAEGDENKNKRPQQPKPYNSVDDYATAHLPMLVPAELTPSTPLPFPHILGFLNTPKRMYRFLTRRYLADEIGKEVAAVCFATYREFREVNDVDPDQRWEQQTALVHEEKNWLKTVWKDPEDVKKEQQESVDASPLAAGSEAVDGSVPQKVEKEKIWPRPMVLDPRIAARMRRFEIQPADEAHAREIVVPEEEIEGWTKGTLRSLWRWTAKHFKNEKQNTPNVGDVD